MKREESRVDGEAKGTGVEKSIETSEKTSMMKKYPEKPKSEGVRKDPIEFVESGLLGGDASGIYHEGWEAVTDYDNWKVRTYNAYFSTRFKDVYWFYANQIDYLRVILNLLAGFTIYAQHYFLSVILLVGSELLDWIDGPVARAYKQGTIFGSGVDWLADVQGQIVFGVWWASLEPMAVPVIIVALTIELSCCVFDFAITMGRYPCLASKQTHWFYAILEWATPSAKYNWFGTFIWLAYPIFLGARCLDLSWPERSIPTSMLLYATQIGLLVPSLLYLWNEAAQCAFIVSHWTEPALRDRPSNQPAKYDDGVFSYEGIVAEDERYLIGNALDVLKQEDYWKRSKELNEIFWVDLCQRSIVPESVRYQKELNDKIKDFEKLKALAIKLMYQCYPNCDVELDGFGFINNPPGSRTQSFHLDYGIDYSSLFIPLENVCDLNQTQYVVLPHCRDSDKILENANKDPDKIDIEKIVDNLGFISVRQLLAKPYSILRMNFGAIHRGITNATKALRVVFYISVVRNGIESVAETTFKEFDNDKKTQ